MWFADLTPYAYLRDERPATIATLNVGWLESGRAYSRGVTPAAAIQRLRELVEHGKTKLTRGMHFCDLCPERGDESHPWGYAEVRVIGADGTRYAAPTLIFHYVAVHAYAPPTPFVDGLLRLADFRWDEAQARELCFACRSSLRRNEVHEGMRIVEGKREPITAIGFDCESCGTGYERMFPR
jgi:hypothetical protein